MKAFLFGAAAALITLAVAAAAVVYGGHVPVAAASPEAPALAGLLHTAYERSIARAATMVAVPGDLDAEARIRRGAYNFQAMCSGCHTPPGTERSVQAAGMNPPPPALAELMAERSPAEAFWVIDQGVRMTAMPAFGPSHGDEELWALVAFIRVAAEMSAEQYAQAVAEARAAFAAGDGHEHSHGPAPRHEDQRGSAHGHHARLAPGNAGALLFGALSDGHGQRVLEILDPQVLVYESGGVEASAEEYAGHHLPHDMAFAADMHKTPLSQRIFEMGDYALVANHTRMHGEYEGEPMRRLSTETLLLKRHDAGWRIAHIHWSSREEK